MQLLADEDAMRDPSQYHLILSGHPEEGGHTPLSLFGNRILSDTSGHMKSAC